MAKVNSTKAMVEAALMSALIIIMTILSRYLATAYVICTALSPVIIAVMCYRNGNKYGLSCAVVSGILSSILFNPVSGITMAISYTLVGMGLGYSIKKGFSPTRTILIVTICGIISLLSEIVVNAFFMGIYNPVEFINQQVTSFIDMTAESMNSMKSMAESMGAADQSLAALDQYNAMFNKDLFMLYIPGAVVTAAFIQGCLCIKVFEFITRRVMKEHFRTLEISNIYIPNLAGAVVIGILCICILLSKNGYSVFTYIYQSLSFVIMFMFILNGACTLEYYLKNKMMMKPPVRLLIIVMVGMIAAQFYMIMGFVEMFLDYRKLDPHRLRKV